MATKFSWDGQTLGEIVIRGNNVTIGYYRDEAATRAAQYGEWFRTGDLGVRFPDGYIELRDRAKDIIITGGENVASVEIEKALAEHPAVLEAVVVGRPDERWGEIPVAFVVLRQGMPATKEELIEFVCERIARFKAPREILFEELPKTSTGKIQKYILRRRFAPSIRPGDIIPNCKFHEGARSHDLVESAFIFRRRCNGIANGCPISRGVARRARSLLSRRASTECGGPSRAGRRRPARFHRF